MRLWLKDSERRADPAPIVTDDRKAMAIGLALWLVALVGVIIALPTLTAGDQAWWLEMCVTGLVLGVIGIAYTQWRRRR